MSNDKIVLGVTDISNLGDNRMDRFIPEPKNTLGLNFGSMLSSVAGALTGGTGALSGMDPSYVALLNKQIEAQVQMQLVSMESNIEKSKHETKMSAIRNLRAA